LRCALKPGDGIFLASCHAHGRGEHTTIALPGRGVQVGYKDLVADWFFGAGRFASHRLVDDCNTLTNPLPCNPTC